MLSGLKLYLPVPWKWVSPSRLFGKLVLLLNGKAKEILAKH